MSESSAHEPKPILDEKLRTSVVHVRDDWYVACASGALRDDPLPITLHGTPIVLFRGEGRRPAALLDRCPHRNVPLSLGRRNGELLECSYHGWCFDGAGECRRVPGLVGKPDARGRRATSFATREHDGYVWIYGTADETPSREPHRFPYVDDPRYATVREELIAPASLHATAENALDVPHTNFLHRGLFRSGGASRDIEVVLTRRHDHVEAEYIGEPRPTGLVGRILAPSGGVVHHWDRFRVPSIVEVEYRIGEDSHVHISGALTPSSDYETRMFSVISFRVPFPPKLVLPIVRPVALRIFAQDAVVLNKQTESIQRFGGEHYASTEIDVLGPHILHLLRKAERGERGAPDDAPFSRRFTMRV